MIVSSMSSVRFLYKQFFTTITPLLTTFHCFKPIIGAFSIEIPKKILRFGKARNSHDTIQYAINGWAAWGHYNIDIMARRKDSDKYVNSKLRLFNCIGTLFAGNQITVFYLFFTIFHHAITVFDLIFTVFNQ